jgi:hypothetical protein
MQHLVLSDIIAELLDTDKSLRSPMMKLYYFAKETGNVTLSTFLSKEINGYQVDDDLPSYRSEGGELVVTVQIGSNRDNITEQVVPSSFFPEKAQKVVSKVQLYEGIGILEKMEATNKTSQYIFKPVGMEYLQVIQPAIDQMLSSVYKLTAINAIVRVNANIVGQACHTVRTKLLDFVHEIKEQFGYDIDISQFKQDQSTNNQTVNNFMGTTIHNTGDGAFINTGDHAHNNVNITIQKGDLTGLNKKLTELGVEPEEIEEISEIVQSETPDMAGKNLGPRASGWVGKMVAKALSGAGKIGVSAAGNILATVIKAYYGFVDNIGNIPL